MLSEDFINTKVIGLTRGMSLKRIKLLILRALDLDTCIPLMLSNEEFEKIAQILDQKSTISFELVDKLTQTFFISLEHLEIICKPYGEHEVYAYFSGGDHLRRLTLSLPLAVALAFHHNMPFRIHRSVFQRTALANEETNQMSFALNDMTEEHESWKRQNLLLWLKTTTSWQPNCATKYAAERPCNTEALTSSFFVP